MACFDGVNVWNPGCVGIGLGVFGTDCSPECSPVPALLTRPHTQGGSGSWGAPDGLSTAADR